METLGFGAKTLIFDVLLHNGNHRIPTRSCFGLALLRYSLSVALSYRRFVEMQTQKGLRSVRVSHPPCLLGPCSSGPAQAGMRQTGLGLMKHSNLHSLETFLLRVVDAHNTEL